MKDFADLILRLENAEPSGVEEWAALLDCGDPAFRQELRNAAYRVKCREVGNLVHLRGLIEVSNVCAKNCYYCGIRRDNRSLERFCLTRREVLEAAEEVRSFGYGSLVLQSGERTDGAFAEFIADLLRTIVRAPGGELGITLSCGEQSEEVYRLWREAGARRYLLRIETSDPDFYRTLHPQDHSFDRRLACLHALRRCGYQLGSGMMIDLPGQTAAMLAKDVAFLRDLDVDMVGMGPYIAHPDTPLGRKHLGYAGSLQRSLDVIALTRLVLRDVNVAATTALQTLAPDGREQGLLAGANVIMPNAGPVRRRKDYLLYAGKPGLDENAAETRQALENSIRAIGESIDYHHAGDPLHALKRR